MEQPLDFNRKKALAKGLLWLLGGMFALKSILLIYRLSGEGWAAALPVAGILLTVTSIVFLAAGFVDRRASRSRWLITLLFPILAFLQLRYLSNLYQMQAWLAVGAVLEQFPLIFATLLLYDDPEGFWVSWKKRWPGLRLGALRATLIAVLALIGLEVLLRTAGFQPNALERPVWFRPVEHLETMGDYAADVDGIMTWSPQAVRYFNDLIAQNPDSLQEKAVDTCSYFHDRELYQSYVDLHKGLAKNEFQHYIEEIRAKPDSARTEIESAWLAQTLHPLNENGFRSIPFRHYDTPQKKVLLIGDSFTWGFSASSVTNSFSEILHARGYVVFNAGITGTDPAQYEAIAHKYIPIIRPDVVVVNFFVGNDIFAFRREIVPYRMPVYTTNAGMINAYPCAEWLPDLETAYRFVEDQYGIPNRETHLFNRICAQTVVTTQLWRGLRALSLAPAAYPNAEYWARCPALHAPIPASHAHLAAIEAECKRWNAEFVLAAIPDLPTLDTKRIPQDYPGVFDGFEVHVPQLSPTDFDASDLHFNNQGHLKYADFLQKLLGATTVARE